MYAYHTMSADEIKTQLNTDIKSGLSNEEAQKRLKSYGKNMLTPKKQKGVITLFFEQLNDFMVIILLIAAFISFLISLKEGNGGFSDSIIILAIVILNSIVGVVQEKKAQKSIDALKKLSSPKATVIRNGKKRKINAQDIVKGDLVSLVSGDIVPADCRIISSTELCVDESSLTGEAVESEKNSQILSEEHLPLGDRCNMLYSSSSVIRGKCLAIATATGMETEVGHIASMLMEEKDEKTPLQKKLSETGKILGIAALIICAVIFIIGLIKHLPPLEMFMTSVSLAVAAIPEGLVAIVTITLSIGVTRLSRHNAIVRHLPSVETLGSASVICSDKTGTITKNQMSAVYSFTKNEYLLYKYANLCTENDTKNPTELAIINKAKEMNIKISDKNFIFMSPFDSDKKYMSVTLKDEKAFITIIKGALDSVIDKCISFNNSAGSAKMTDTLKSKIRTAENKAAADGLRVIAVAYRKDNISPQNIPDSGFTFLGLIGFLDPPRDEVADAVKMCKSAGIIPVMITGDHAKTAESIAKKCGIITEKNPLVITGPELDKMDDNTLLRKIKKCSVFARVTPAHKVRIVNAWQRCGEIVAMTGDGVNDAPSLKAADIGCSMGLNGTEVAKEASDMILTDDNFATIVLAVSLGRSVFSNIKKAVQFLLSSNIGEILTVFTGLVFGFSAPLNASELLWVNLVTDSMPAIALGLDKESDDLMHKPPKRGGIFSGGLWGAILFEGLLIGALSLTAFSIGVNVLNSQITGRTMAFAVLSISQLVHAFNMKSEKSVIKHLFSNKYLNLSFILGVLLQVIVITVPSFAKLFDVTPLGTAEWITVFSLSFVPLAVVELQKKLNLYRK